VAEGVHATQGEYESLIELWSLATGAKLRALRGGGRNPSPSGLGALAFSPICKRLAAATYYPGFLIKIWDTATGKELLTLPSRKD
jgi:WD40 repeat protein